MTDKEYVKELKNFTTEKLITQMEYFGVDPYYTEVWEPTLKEIERRLKIADEALKSGDWGYTNTPTNTPTDDDTISRQAAMSAIYSIGAYMGRKDAMDTLRSLPPVTHDKHTETHGVCSDYISRKQAIEAIEGVDWYHVNPKGELVHGSTSDDESWYRAEDVYKAIESLPQDDWIPVSEGLPKKNGDYIVSLEDSIYPWGRFFNGKWYMLPRGGVAVEFGANEVIAWMPLPEIYRPEGENK